MVGTRGWQKQRRSRGGKMGERARCWVGMGHPQGVLKLAGVERRDTKAISECGRVPVGVRNNYKDGKGQPNGRGK